MTELNRFIQEELEKRKRDYTDSPAYILEHYNKEQQNIQSYNGRQLFEMLQNADDEAETAINPKVVIKLSGNTLTISNNGKPFSKEGLRSIIYSDLSHKPMQQNKIGQKGLGFRSILSWADEVIIDSGNAKIGFSEKYAKSFLKGLLKASPLIGSFLKDNNKTSFPIATLRIPQILAKTSKAVNKFDTTISIKLKKDVLHDVQSQITNTINKETLLFLNNLKIIEIDSPKTKITFTKIVNETDTITVKSKNFLDNQTESKTWSIKKVTGKHKEKNYELAIAWNKDLDDKENVLYTYFKTQVRFPFPALLHGTFELTSNRNQLVNDTDGHNQFLTEKLAELLVQTSLEIASKDNNASYLPLKLLNINFDRIDSIFSDFNFKETLIEKIKSSKVFPNVNGLYLSYSDEPVYYDYPIADILSGKDVNKLMLHCDDIALVKFIKILTNRYYIINYFASIISKRLNILSYSHLAKLFYHLFTFEIYKTQLSSIKFTEEFLPDNENKPISWDSSIFLPQQNDLSFNLPKSLKVRLVNPELIKHLLNEFHNYEIIQNFEQLSVREYSFLDIALTLINHYRDRNNLKLTDIRELHFYLFRLFKNEKEKYNKLSANIDTPVISVMRKIKKANEIYFGRYYGNDLAEQLYSFDKSKLLASPKAFGLENENEKIVKEYFIWLGVSELPRYSIISLNRWSDEYKQYKEHILRNFDYKKPIDSDFNNYYKNYNHFLSELDSGGKIEVGHFDDLKNILAKSAPESIFQWIKKEEMLKRTLTEDAEIFFNAKAEINIKGKRTPRKIKYQNLRSYTRWLFSNISWLPVDSNEKIAEPDRCCLSKTITKEFSPFVERPKIDIASLADKLELPEDTVETFLINVGVHREISDFSTARLYEMLLSLPVSDKTGNVAKSIYREIINNFVESKLDITHPTYEKFLRSGKILCQKGNEISYFEVDKAFYIDTKIFGRNILKRFPLVTIDRKRGSPKVKRLFGVKPLENIKFNLFSEPENHHLQSIFHEEIQRFKGLVYALRIHQDTKHSIRNRLKMLKIILSSSIEADFLHNQKAESFKLENYEFLIHTNKNTFYILVPKNIDSVNELKGKIDFRESIAEIFTSLINTEDYRSFIRELYSTPEIDRETLLMNEIQQDTNDIIVEAKNKLDIIDDIRLSFWRAFSISSKRKLKTEINSENDLISYIKNKLILTDDISQKLLSLDTYSNLSEVYIQKLFYKLFLDFKVNFDNFSRHFSGLNFIDVFKSEFENVKGLYQSSFSGQLFIKLKNEQFAEKKKFFQFMDEYDSLKYESKDGFQLSIKEYFINTIKDRFSINLKDVSVEFSFPEIINKNGKAILEKGIIIPETLIERKDIQVMILFNEIDELQKAIREYNQNSRSLSSNTGLNQINVRGKNISYADYQSLKTQVLDGIDFSKLKIKISKTTKVENFGNKGTKVRIRGNQRKVHFSRNEEQIGFISELLCFNLLCHKYGSANVSWVSENAFRAKINITAEAGKGYDIQLLDNNEIRYIEVKGISDVKNGVKISLNEINNALEFSDNYDLLIVEQPLSQNPNFRYIKNPFRFRKNETFMSNNKFTVFNDNYLIKFNWNE